MNLKNSTFEWLCKGGETSLKRAIRIAAQFTCILFGIMGIILFWYLPFMLIALLFGLVWFFLYRERKIEYEFSYIMGDLDIFKISNGARRKKKFHCTLDDIDYIRKGIDNHSSVVSFYFNPELAYTMQVSVPEGKKNILLETEERFIQLLKQEHKLRD